MSVGNYIIDHGEKILVTGANGFVGSVVVEKLLVSGFSNLRCFVRPSSDITKLEHVIADHDAEQIEIYKGTLLSKDDCHNAMNGVTMVIHLAAGIGKSFPDCFMNSVITTRNLLDAVPPDGDFKRFLNISSFAVYTNRHLRRGELLDETCEVDRHPEQRHEPYAYGKLKQDELLLDYHQRKNIPYVIMRPGVVFGPGNPGISPRVGIDTFGFFLHLGGRNLIPLTYVDNCAEAIMLTALSQGVDGEVFNIVDDDLPSSRAFLKSYKKNVKKFRSLYIPYHLFYFFCFLWEKYAAFSKDQLPPLFNRGRCAVYWKGNRYSNNKLKSMVGWQPKISITQGLDRYFSSARKSG